MMTQEERNQFIKVGAEILFTMVMDEPFLLNVASGVGKIIKIKDGLVKILLSTIPNMDYTTATGTDLEEHEVDINDIVVDPNGEDNLYVHIQNRFKLI